MSRIYELPLPLITFSLCDKFKHSLDFYFQEKRGSDINAWKVISTAVEWTVDFTAPHGSRQGVFIRKYDQNLPKSVATRLS